MEHFRRYYFVVGMDIEYGLALEHHFNNGERLGGWHDDNVAIVIIKTHNSKKLGLVARVGKKATL